MTTIVLVNCAAGAYTLVGQGPLTVQLENGPSVWVQNGASQPSAATTGTLVAGTAGVDFPNAALVWAMPVPGAIAVDSTVGVTYDLGNNAGSPSSMVSGAVTANVGSSGALALEAGHLATIDAKTPALGQALAAASVPVALPATQLATLASPTIGGVAISLANPVPIYDAYNAPTTVSWTSATAANSAQTLNTAGYDTIIITFVPTGTITAGAVVFEAFDGYNWVMIKAPRTDSYQTDATFVLSGSPGIHSWQVPVAGYPQFRARLSVAIVGSGSVQVVSIVSSAPDVSLVTVGMDPSSPLPAGTNNIGTVTLGAGTATIGNTFDEALATIVDSTSNALYVYFCEAAPGTATSTAAWRVSRLELSTGKTTWASNIAGTIGSFKDIADNRNTTITYS